MKSIVLCERTLVQESEEFDLKEEKISEEGNEEEKIFNGRPDNKKSENHKDISEKYEMTFQNGDNSSSELLVKEDVSATDEKKPRSPMASTNKTVESGYEKKISLEIAKNSSSGVKSETDSSVNENISSESEIFKISDAQNDSHVEDRNLKKQMDILDRIDVVGDNAIQIIESETSLHNADGGFSKQNCEIKVIEEEEEEEDDDDDDDEDDDDVERKGNMQPLEDIVIYLDENKENEKEETTSRLENCSDGLLTKHSSECEIQVGEVQTISGLEKDSMWAENDLKKSEEGLKENLEENLMNDSNEENTNMIEGEKEEGQELDSDDNIVLDAEESIEEGMHIEVEEAEQTEDAKVEEKEREVTDLDTFSAKKTAGGEVEDKIDYSKSENVVCRKRQIPVVEGENSSFKKRKFSKDEEDADQMILEEEEEEEETRDSSPCENLANSDAANSPSKGQLSPEAKTITTKRTSTDDKDPKKLKNSENSEEAKIKNHQTTETVFSVLEKFRGTLKTLTRSDLEELIVQKLCEVITERSNVGELRRKAQALEQDQERWKAKAQSLTKQMREMEMVMRKYMSEVHKQIKEGDNQVVTPLKVTRSVGLQVSFYSSTNKTPKANLPQSVPSNLPPQNVNTRNGKGPPSKLPSQFSPVTQNARNKSTPTFQKGPPSLQKSPVNQQRRPIVPKPDYSANPSVRSAVIQQSLLNNSRGVPNQVQASRPNYKPTAGTSSSQQQQQQPHHQSLQQLQQQQQNGSKVIDLTEDDDRQTGNTGKTSGPVRVINHLTQPPSSQNNRFAYLLPTTSASTGSPVGQGRQVLIATPTMPQPNRQIMCSMPPLLFKGSSPVQSGSQPQMLNQSNKVILPKAVRHPAPLPQRPINQSTKRTLKLPPPKPALKISKVQTGIVLSWNMSLGPEHAPIASYQLYAYQESDSPPATSLWKKVGDVKALPLPMACTLTQFMSGHKYHFAVRAVDLFSRIGPFSYPGTIVLV